MLRTWASAHRQTARQRGSADSEASATPQDPHCGCISHPGEVPKIRADFVIGYDQRAPAEVLLFFFLAPRWFKIVICRGPECGDRRGSAALMGAFESALQAGGATNCDISWQSCFGRCTQGPNVLVREVGPAASPQIGSGFATSPGPRGATALYNRMDGSRVRRVVSDHVVGGEIIREFIERPGILYSQPVGSKEKDSS